MSNNAAVTEDGGEIGRAQALQARACGIPVSRHMNPVLLKPEGEGVAQLVVQGRREARMGALAFHAKKPTLMPRILESYAAVAQGRDLVLVEGAGDIANMGFAPGRQPAGGDRRRYRQRRRHRRADRHPGLARLHRTDAP